MRHVEPRYTESLVGYKIAPYIRAMLLELKRWCRSKRNPENSEAHMADCKAGAGRHKGTAYVGDASKQASSQANKQLSRSARGERQHAGQLRSAAAGGLGNRRETCAGGRWRWRHFAGGARAAGRGSRWRHFAGAARACREKPG